MKGERKIKEENLIESFECHNLRLCIGISH